MTDTERNIALAALIGTDGYKAAKTCPQGHKNYHMVYIHGGSSTNWEENKPWRTGDLCPTCIIDGTKGLQLLDLEDAYAIAENKAEEHGTHPEYHPEWRIQAVPKDFTQPGVLEPLARKLVAQWEAQRQPVLGWQCEYESRNDDCAYLVTMGEGFGYGPTYEIALGEALLSAAERIHSSGEVPS